MTDSTICRTQLLDDKPADQDAFASGDQIGPHQRVADAIGELIESADEGGIVVGLEGGWGTGKSTVVSLLSKRFEDKSDYTIILFDAWAHEGDPLRRTYLETLIRHLQSKSWIEKEPWDQTLDSISHRVRETSTRTVPKPTTLGTLVGLSVFGVPFGSALVSAALHGGVTVLWGKQFWWMFIIGAVLGLGPFIVLLGNLFRILVRRLRKKASGHSDWNLLLSHAITETHTETVEAPNPTSIEFEDTFARLMQDALSAHPNRGLLLILDNLDRVDPDSALAIWSTLQTFLQDRHYRDADWFKRLWIVVPYDPVGLRRLWDGRTANGWDAEPNVADGKTNDLQIRPASQSFIDKSFQVRFHVPPPVLSNWRSYLYGLIQTALPDHPFDDRHLIYRVFDYCRARTGDPPTPRELKIFVNQIGAIHRQWQHTFPVAHVAYFVLRCREHRSLIDRLRSLEVPSQDDVRFFGQDLQASLAGMAFNVAGEKGLELLLAEPIYQSLSNGKHEELKQLAQHHRDGFWAVLEIVVSTRLDGDHAATIATTASCLLASGILTQHQGPETTTISADLKRAALDVNRWIPFNHSMANGIAALCELRNEELFSKSLMKAVALSLSENGNDSQEAASQPNDIIDSLLTVLNAVSSLGHDNALPEFTLPVDAEGWAIICERLWTTDSQGRFWNRLRPKCDFTEISTVVKAAIERGRFTDRYTRAIRITSGSPMTCEWKEVVSAMRQRLDAGQKIEPGHAHSLLVGLCELQYFGSAEATSALKELANSGHVLHQYQRATAENHHDCRAICAFVFLRVRANAKKPRAVGNSDAGHDALSSALGKSDIELAKRYLSLLERYDELALLFRMVAPGSSYGPVVSHCLRQIADSEAPERLFEPDVILKRWQDLRVVLDEEGNQGRFVSLMGVVAAKTNLCELIEGQEQGFVSQEVALYSAIVEGAADKGLDVFYPWCRTGLEHLSKDEWNAGLSEDFSCVRLALLLDKHDSRPELSTNFTDALHDHAKALVAGNRVPPEDVRSEWQIVLECIRDEGTRKVLRERLVEAAVSQDGQLHTAFFEIYGREIADSGTLAANPRVVSHLLSAIVRERNVGGLQWLATFLSDNDGFLNAVSAEHTVQEFENRLRECISRRTEDQAQRLIDKIAAILGVQPDASDSEVVAEDSKVEDETKGDAGTA